MDPDAFLERIRALERRLAAWSPSESVRPHGGDGARDAGPAGRSGDGRDGADLLEAVQGLRADLERAGRESDADRRALDQLREAEARWRSILENPYDYVVVVDRQAVFQYVNHTAPNIKMEDLLGKATMYDYTSPEHHDDIRRAITQAFDDGKPATYEAYSPQVDAWFSVVVAPILRDGRVAAASVVARDISRRKRMELELRDSEERFRQLAEHIEDLFYLLDVRQGRALFVSQVYEHLYERSLDSIYADARSWLDAVHPEDRDSQESHWRAMLATCAGAPGGTYRFGQSHEFRVVRPDGSMRWVRARNFPVHDATGVIARVAGIITDITERREAEQRRAEAEAKYRLLVESLPVISYIARLDEARTTVYVSPQIESKLGYTQAEWTADPELWSRRIHPDDRLRVFDAVRRLREGGAFTSIPYRLLARDGDVVWCRDHAVLVRDEAGRPTVQGVIVDVTEAEEARAEQQRAQATSARLVEVQENERRRIARELHDEVGQTLTGLGLLLQMIHECPGEWQGALTEARGLVGELMERVRDLSLELRPSMLDDLGLVPALLNMFERYTKQTQVQVRFEHRGLEERMDSEVETAAFRAVQEALTNVARHAQVREVRVRAWSDGSTLNLLVQDAGPGFDVGSALCGSSRGGLLGMRERVALLGGEMTMESGAGGTTVAVRLPVRECPVAAPRRAAATPDVGGGA